MVVIFGAGLQAALALCQVSCKLSFQFPQLRNLLPDHAQLGREHVPHVGTGCYLLALQRQ